MEYNGESLSDRKFTIIEERPKMINLDMRLRTLYHSYDGRISISTITNGGYDQLKKIYENTPEEDFNGCFISKQELSSILSRYKNRYLERIIKSKELRKTLESDLWGGIEGLFISVDGSYNRIIDDRYGRSEYTISEIMRLVHDEIVTIDDITDFASLIDYANRGLMDIAPKNPDSSMIDSWLRLLDKLNDVESRRFG